MKYYVNLSSPHSLSTLIQMGVVILGGFTLGWKIELIKVLYGSSYCTIFEFHLPKLFA